MPAPQWRTVRVFRFSISRYVLLGETVFSSVAPCVLTCFHCFGCVATTKSNRWSGIRHHFRSKSSALSFGYRARVMAVGIDLRRTFGGCAIGLADENRFNRGFEVSLECVDGDIERDGIEI